MKMRNPLHPRVNVDRLYRYRKEDGRELQGVKEAVKLTNLQLENISKSLESVCLLMQHL